MNTSRAALVCWLTVLLPAAAGAQAINLRSELPRTLILIQEEDQPRIAFREVTAFLRAANFPLIDPGLVGTGAARPQLRAALAGDEQAAIQLGRDFGAHLLVLGKAEWDSTLDNSSDKRETRTAQITLRAIRLDGGALVATATGRGSAIDANGQRARTRAVRYAIHEIVQRSEFVGALANNWEEVSWSNRSYFRPDPGSKVASPWSRLMPPSQKTLPQATPAGSEKWAVIVGVGTYRSSHIAPVRYAADDALALHDFLRSPAGGELAPDHVLLLTNEQATLRALREALFVFLQKARSDDVVLIYFAGHGVPDPARPENLYLLPHDAELSALASTGLPLWDFKTALRRHIKAERVVVLSDANHAGGVPAGTVNPINSAFQDLFTPSQRLALIAGENNQESHEDVRWGGGHGVFTYSLLEGLRGAADRDHDRVVTFAEVAEYVIASVKSATSGRQAPVRVGASDVTLAYVPTVSASGEARR